MKAPKFVLATLTVAALAAAPAVATAASTGPNQSGSCSDFYCGGGNNHNEVLVTSTGG